MELRRVASSLLLPLALVAMASAPAPAPARFALIVGINDYANYDDEAGGDLRGAVRDARSMRDVLVERWGIADENIRLLLDLEATRENMRKGFTEWLPERVSPGDMVVFFFAGHGSQAYDADGDEEDGLDETICPTDVFQNSFEKDITDDTLRQWIDGLPTREVVVILDSCHSGTGTRIATPTMRPRLLGRDLSSVEGEPPPAALRSRGEETVDADVEITSGEDGVLEVASAAPDQTAMDAWFPPTGTRGGEGYSGGAFTTHFVEKLRQAVPSASYREVFEATVAAMKADGFTQDPQLTGPATAPLFTPGPAAGEGETTVLATAPGVVRVTAVDGDRITLAAGSGAGVTPGSIYEGASGQATARIIEVAEDGATGVVEAGAVAAGDELTLVARSLPAPTLVIDGRRLAGPLGDSLRSALAGNDRVRWTGADDADRTDLHLRPSEDDPDGVSVFGRDGRLRYTVSGSPEGSSRSGAVARILRKELAVKRLAALENPAGPFRLELDIAGDERQFTVDDTIAFRVRSERAGHLTLLDLSPDGTVTVLFPNAYHADSRIEAGETLEVPTSRMPFVFLASPPLGWGLVRAIVTEEPLDLPGVEDGLAQSSEGAPLVVEVEAALRRGLGVKKKGGGEEAGGAEAGAVSTEGWTTTLAVYRVTGKSPEN